MDIVCNPDFTGFAPPSEAFQAVDADTYDGEGCPVGVGASKAEAIADLIEKLGA